MKGWANQRRVKGGDGQWYLVASPEGLTWWVTPLDGDGIGLAADPSKVFMNADAALDYLRRQTKEDA